MLSHDRIHIPKLPLWMIMKNSTYDTKLEIFRVLPALFF